MSKSPTSFAAGGTASTSAISAPSRRWSTPWCGAAPTSGSRHSSAIRGSRHGRMRELRVPGRPPIRVFYAFDPYRTAILLIAGHKTDSERFYRDYVPRADAIYDDYLREIEDERRRAITRGGPKQ